MKVQEEWGSLKSKATLLPGTLKLSEARASYQDNTRSLSAVTRQLAFAGIAIVWIFKASTNGTPSIPENLRIPTLLFVAALGADLLQYVSSAASWGIFEGLMERKFQKDHLDEKVETFGAPNSINWLGNSFLVMKVSLLVVAYIWLFFSLYQHLF